MVLRALFFIYLIVFTSSIWAQGLSNERIWKIGNRKKGIYQDRGVFHSGVEGTPGVLLSVRHSMNKEIQAERIVLDFSGEKIPRVYGHISPTGDKIYIDLFSTTMNTTSSFDGKGEYLKTVEFYPISKDILSLELGFKHKVTADVFFLEAPGRFVIDIKK
ncbi:MAG: hypothetical protein ACOYL6_05070 [Bacteriovoracaceae bacterium]